ncbi:MAG: hypothetical protein EXR92_04530 [Gemmatimonadetes bacterium]|nr:hypothetical protein [Gemmatimonadota bacterium]
MTFEEFGSEAHRLWAEVPAEYKEGIDGIVVRREAEAHEDHDDYYTMGMCFTEPYPSGYGGPETTRSFLALYHGSFARVADGDPDFSWEEELWETITHELQHHLEFLAEDDALEGVDYALEESYKRERGLDFDPWYYQSGQPLAPSVYRVERDVYIEQQWRAEAFERTPSIEFEWSGRRWSVARPDELGDVHFIWVHDLDAGGGWLQLALLRKLGWWEGVVRVLRRQLADVRESEAEPRDIGDAPGSPGPEEEGS